MGGLATRSNPLVATAPPIPALSPPSSSPSALASPPPHQRRSEITICKDILAFPCPRPNHHLAAKSARAVYSSNEGSHANHCCSQQDQRRSHAIGRSLLRPTLPIPANPRRKTEGRSTLLARPHVNLLAQCQYGFLQLPHQRHHRGHRHCRDHRRRPRDARAYDSRPQSPRAAQQPDERPLELTQNNCGNRAVYNDPVSG